MIRIICVGKIKEDYLKNAITDYYSRINKYHKIEIVELKDDTNILREEEQIIKYIDTKSFNILMDIKGQLIDSPALSTLIDSTFVKNSVINFIIGGSNGVTNKIKNLVNIRLSFGNITIPHGVFRLVLLEQIYRSFKIINNEQYHK